jgi:hypothetical protein
MKKLTEQRPFADPEAAARKLIEIAAGMEPVQDDRLHTERLNAALMGMGASGAEYGAGVKLAIDRGWLWQHESGTYFRLMPAGNDLFA